MKKNLKKSTFTLSIIFVMVMTLFVPNENPFIYTVSASNYVSRGIDVSTHNGTINWNSVANSNIDFAIIRAGSTIIDEETFYKDSRFETNYSGATNAGLKVGAYYYCGAYSKEGFENNAYDFVNALNGKSFDLPVFIDIEQASKQKDLGKTTLTTYILSALDIINNSGYKAGVYANRDWFDNRIDISRIRNAGYAVWYAQYPSGSYAVDPDDYDKSSVCNIWQYSSLGKVNGISGNVDVNVAYTNYTGYTGTSLAAPEVSVSVDGQIATISWNKVKNATHYDLRLYYANGKSLYDHWGGDPNELSMRFKMNPGDYKVQVCSADDNGNFVYCNPVNFSIKSEQLVAPNVKVSVDGQTATISWDRVKAATRYDLRLYCADGTSVLNNWGNNADELSLSYNLDPGDYKVQVCSADNDGNFVYCSPVYFTIKSEPLVAPKINVFVSGQYATVSWAKVKGATHYDLRLYYADGRSLYDNWGGSPDELSLTFKMDPGDYKVQVCSADDNGNFVYCNPMYFTIESSINSNMAFEDYPSATISEGTYYLSPKCGGSNSCIDSEGGETLSDNYNHNIHLWQYLGNANQHFSIEYAGEKDGKKLYYIKNTLTNQYLTLGDERNLTESPYKISLSKWYFIDCGNGYYKIINYFHDLAIDIFNAGSSNGTNAWCYDPSDMNNSAQLFKLNSVS